MPRSPDVPIAGSAWWSFRPKVRMKMDTWSQVPKKFMCRHACTHTHTHTHTRALLRGTATPKCCGFSATTFCFSSCSRAPRDPGKQREGCKVPAELPPHPSREEPAHSLETSPTDQNHQAGLLARLVLVPGHLLVGRQLRRLGHCGCLSFLRASQSLPAAQPEAPPKTSLGRRAGGHCGICPSISL